MHVLYISQYYPPEACAPAARVDAFTQEWASAGAEATVLTGFPNHPEGVIHPDYLQRWRRGFAVEARGGVKVHRTWLYPSANRKLWGRGLNFLSFAVSAGLAGPWLGSGKAGEGVVIATSPQILVGLAGWVASALRFRPWVFEVRDLWPESLIGVGQTHAGSMLYRSVGLVADFLYPRATHLVVDGEWKRRYLIHRGVEEGKISVVRNGVEEHFCFDPASARTREARARLRKELRLGEQFVLLYAGTLGMAHGLETVLKAAERLRDCGDVTFLLMGAGAEREPIYRHLERLRLGNVRLLEKQLRENVPAFLAAADACVIPLRKREVFKTAIPSTLFEAMAAAKPVILGVEGEAKEILLASGAGVAIEPENPEAMTAAIRHLRENPEFCRALGASGRRAVMEKYLRSTQAAKYLELLTELAARSKHSLAHKPWLYSETGRVRVEPGAAEVLAAASVRDAPTRGVRM